MNTAKTLRVRTLCAIMTISALASFASAQLSPDRLYYGVNRKAPMTVTRPAGAAGDLTVRMLKADTAAELESASVSEGGVDLAALFPSLWTAKEVRYAQLFAGDTPVGPAVVIQPLITPRIATGGPRGSPPQFAPSQGVFSGVRAYTEKNVVWETDKGQIIFRLRPDIAPNTAWNFRHLADGGYYTDVIFHRIIDAKDGRPPFVVQVGDPTGTGSGGPGYMLDLEPSTLPHDFGVLSMARSNDPNTNGSQVFVALSRAGTSFLDNNYTTFGEAVSGGETILAIAAVKTNAQDRPDQPPIIKKAYLQDAPPYGTGPDRVQRASDPVGR